jgi:hemolysin activation/secretion protein
MSDSLKLFRNLLLVGGLSSGILADAMAVWPTSDDVPGSVVPSRIQLEVVPLPLPESATQIHYADMPTCKIDLQFHKRTPRLRNVLVRNQGAVLPAQVSNLYRPYLGYLISPKNVEQLADSIAQFYRQQGYFAAEVVVPQQNLRNGVLEIIIYKGAVGDVQIDNKTPRIQNRLQHYANDIKKLNPLTRPRIERDILLAGQIVGAHVKADITADEQRPGCVKVCLTTDMQRLGADVGYDNYGVRWQGPHQYAANVFGNSLLQSGDHTQVNAMMSVDGEELRYYAAEHNMPLGYSGLRLALWANYAHNEPGFTLKEFDIEGEAFSAGADASYPFLLNLSQEFWGRLGVRLTQSKMESDDEKFYGEDTRVVLAGFDYQLRDCWQGLSQVQLTLSRGLDVLDAEASDTILLARDDGRIDFTKLNAEISYARPIIDNFSLMVGGQGQYGFNTLLISELMGIGGRYWGRAYDWSEIMGDSGVVGTVELRYDTKPGAPEHKSTQYFLSYDAGQVWVRHAPEGFGHASLTSVQAGLRLEFTPYLSADLVVAKPLTRDVSAEELAGHSGDGIRTFFRVALHI